MDSLDLQIINILKDNGRITNEELSKRLNVSRPAVHNRINKLEQEGIITGYSTNINWQKLGYVTNSLISLKVNTIDFSKTIQKIKNIRIDNLVVEECHRVTGEWCIIMKVRTLTPIEITKLHDELLKMKEITDTSTLLILSSSHD